MHIWGPEPQLALCFLLTVVGWPLGCPETCGCLSCTQCPGLPTVSSTLDRTLRLTQSHLLSTFSFGVSHVPGLSHVQKRSRAHSTSPRAAWAPECLIVKDEARRCAGPEREGGPETSRRRERQASSSRRGHAQVTEAVWAQQTKERCSVRERALLLPKWVFFLKFRHFNPSFTSLA